MNELSYENLKDKDLKLEYLFPLGTVVKLKDIKEKFMITGYFVVVEKTNDEKFILEDGTESDKKVFDYLGVLWPQGDFDQKKKLMFNHDAIEKVYFYGYTNDVKIKYKPLNIKKVKN